ncbi:MAG: hypothetical protein WED11_08105 [Natronospirillum sp.]
MTTPNTKRGYKSVQLWVVLLTPLIVIGVSTVIYFSGWLHPDTTTNNGDLIYPPVELEDIGVAKDDGHWWMLTVSDGPCLEACEEQLYWIQQLHIGLGRESPRVRRRLLSDVPVTLSTTYPGLEWVQGNLNALPLDGNLQLFIVDPIGNVMLKFSPTLGGSSIEEYKEVREDLRKLLSRSTIG